MEAGGLARWRLHIGALAVLVLCVGVAAVGGVEPSDVESAARREQQAAEREGRSTSSGLALDDLQVEGDGGGDGDAALGDGARRGTSASAASTGGSSAAAPADGTTGPSTPAGPQASGPAPVYDVGVSDTEIKIGGSTFTSGPAAVYGEQIAVGFAAGVNYINRTGGINGRRVTLKLYDDGADPAKQLANTKRLLEVDKVFALSMVYAASVGDYVASKAVPVFHLGQFDEEFTNPWWFPVGGPQRLASYQMARFGTQTLKAKSVAVFYLDAGAANYSRAYAEQVAQDWKAYGAKVPVLAPFAPDQTSCSDAVGKARDAGVDFIQFEIDAGKVINCGVEAQIQGYKPPKGWGGYLIGVPVIHEALGDYSEGMYAFDAFGANYDAKVYKEAVKEVSAKTESYSSVTISYFISALLMRDAIGSLGNNITRVRLRDALNGFHDWRPGLTQDHNQPSWTWTPQCHVALKGGYVIQIQKQDDGELRWTQITPQFTTSFVPPGQQPPARFAGCDVFTRA